MFPGVLLTPCGPFYPLSSPLQLFFFKETNYSHIRNHLWKENINLYCPPLIISVLKSRANPCSEGLALGWGTWDLLWCLDHCSWSGLSVTAATQNLPEPLRKREPINPKG